MSNSILTASLLAWGLAQVSKFFVWRLQRGKFDLRLLVSAGGMPSSHSALVSALATSVGLQEGFSSSAFAISFVLAMIVMYDATGVRRAASIQAHILNQILEELFKGHPISEKRLRELLGHTPMEVVVGALMGILVSLIMMGLWFNPAR
ncbi:MAG: divergent PAP2 family protein [Chloroflexi bacterium]|nr:MAG: divergent PAP2 family protein [Chloroflexota bacterium]HDN79906.1 divergent PAP2 family protein [Chloroflexota bacterium]